MPIAVAEESAESLAAADFANRLAQLQDGRIAVGLDPVLAETLMRPLGVVQRSSISDA